MKKILITNQIVPPAEEILSKHFAVEIHPGAMTKQQLCQAAGSYDGMLTTVMDSLDAEVLSHAKSLQVIANYGIGLNNIDLTVAKSKGIAVYNLPDIVTDSTADLTMALILAFERQIPQSAKYVQDDLWKAPLLQTFLGSGFEKKNLGVIGFGRIGQAVAKRAAAFGMSILAYHPTRQIDPALAKQVTWEELLATSDILSLHVPLTPDTRKMIEARAFSQMKKHPLLVNTARGAVVDTDALILALNTGQIRGAALDVTDPEPLSASHPLAKAPNCLIVPHIGTATHECRRAMSEKAAKLLVDHFSAIC